MEQDTSGQKNKTELTRSWAEGYPSSAFSIGQDQEGHWLALQASGLRGGIFANKDAAVHYAREETHKSDNQLYFVAEPLDF